MIFYYKKEFQQTTDAPQALPINRQVQELKVADKQKVHSRHIPAPLSRTQERTTQHQRIGKGLRYQQNHRLQIQEPLGSIKTGSRDWLPVF